MVRKPNRKQRRKLDFDRLESRAVPAILSLPTTADGQVSDTNLDGTFETLNTTDITISDRWFSPSIGPGIGEERGVFEFDLRGIAPGSTINGAALSIRVASFTSSLPDLPQLVVRTQAGDGAVTLSDATAPSFAGGTGTIQGTGSISISLSPASITPFLGGGTALRVQNANLDGQFASFYSRDLAGADFRARLLLDVAEPTVSVRVQPGAVSEAAGANAALAIVTRTGDISQPLVVTLNSNDTTEATVPATVTIPAFQYEVSVPIAAVDDLIVDGTQNVTISANAQIVTGGGGLSLDTTFGSGGLASTSLLMQIQFPSAVIKALPDGKILAASELTQTSWQITRLNANGSVDTSFGVNGVVSTTIAAANSSFPVPHVLELQSDGKFLVGGKFSGGTGQAILVRYNTDGTLDGSFGAIATDALSAFPNAWVTDIAVRPNGKILLGMGENGSVFARVVQLNATGSRDSTFGSNGLTMLNSFSNFGASATQVELLPDGTFLAAGAFSTTARVAQVNANGVGLVSVFGGGSIGMATFDFGGSVQLAKLLRDTQGRIVFGCDVVPTGSSQGEFAVGRLNPNGTIDTTFAGDGTAVLVAPVVGREIATGMVIQANDKIILSGVSTVSSVSDSAMARFNADGSRDNTFDGDGFFRQSLVNTFSPDIIFGVTLQPDGKLLALTGWATDMRVARFNVGGVLNLSASANLAVLDDEPTAQSLNFSTAEDTPLNASLAATDLDNDTLTFSIVTNPANGSVTITDIQTGAFTFTPSLDFNGITTFTYRVNDGTADSNIATVTIRVSPVNDAPVARDDAFSVNEDGQLTVAEPGVLGNDLDVENNALTVGLVAGPSHGSLALNGNGSFVYTPAANFNGTDTFTYRATDGSLDSAVATVVITVNAVNDAPTAQPQTIETNEDTGVSGLLGANDIDSSALTYALVSGPTNGTVVVNSDGTFTYTPAANINGTDSFTFKANDGFLDSNVATVSITVNAVNDAPVAFNQAIQTNEDTAVSGLLGANDIDSSALTFALVSGPTNGTVVVNGDGTFTYTPAGNFNGSDSFEFKASDGSLDSSSATVSITVNAVNDTPVAFNQSIAMNEDASVTAALDAVDVESSPLTFVKVADPLHGTVVILPNGSFTYTPDPNYHGTDSFRFKANDGALDSNEATVSISVSAVNDAPVALDLVFSITEDGVFGGLVDAFDVDRDPITFSLVSGPAHGVVNFRADGTFIYAPDLDYFGPDSFTFKASDGALNSNIASASITVVSVNDAPIASSQSVQTNEDTTVSGSVSAFDIDSGSLTYGLVAGPAHGTLVFRTNGTFTYTPTENYNGPDSFTFKANDGALDSNEATVSISVAAVNDPPVASNLAVSTNQNVAVSGAVSASDVENSPLTYQLVTGPSHGSVTLNLNGTFTYTPAANYFGADSFTFRASDGAATSNVATVSIQVIGTVLRPTIDIEPGNSKNEIDLHDDERIEVAILSSATFDARTVDVESLRFGRTGTEDSLSRKGKKGTPRYSLRDVNRDGRIDLVVEFDADETGFRAGDTRGILTGRLLNGTFFSADDMVKIKSSKRC